MLSIGAYWRSHPRVGAPQNQGLSEKHAEPFVFWVPNGFQNRALYLQRARARARPVSFCVKGVKLLKAQD